MEFHDYLPIPLTIRETSNKSANNHDFPRNYAVDSHRIGLRLTKGVTRNLPGFPKHYFQKNRLGSVESRQQIQTLKMGHFTGLSARGNH